MCQRWRGQLEQPRTYGTVRAARAASRGCRIRSVPGAMGIETLVARALNKVLGNFVEDISPESLKLAVLSGRASLE
jgi:hypothetical protein